MGGMLGRMRMRMRMRLRKWVPVMVSVAAGVAVVVGWAWGLALVADLHTFRGQYRTDARSWRTPAYLVGVLPPPAAGREMPGRVWGYRQSAVDFPVPTGDPSRSGGWFTVWSAEFGWPWYALRWDELNFRPMHDDLAKDKIREVQDAFAAARLVSGVSTPWVREPNGRARRVPVAVIWAGFLGDAALFGGAFWAAVFGPGVVRRWWRRRKGRCPACGYDRAGLPRCPECGA